MSKYLKPRYALSATAIFLAGLLLFGVISHMVALNSGREITIPARGYDPRDILLGHYVRLQPDLDVRLKQADATELYHQVGQANRASDWAELWLLLERDQDVWKIIRADTGRLTGDLTPDQVQIRAESYLQFDFEGEEPMSVLIRPEFGLDRFYANRTEALRIEDSLREGGDVKLVLSVTKGGAAHMKGLEVNGERTLVSWW